MRLTIRLLGTEVLHISTDPDSLAETGPPGDCTTYPVGFVASSPDQRWSEHQVPEG